MVIGDAKSVKEQLETLSEALTADELLLIPLMSKSENRQHAIECLAAEFNLIKKEEG